MRSRENDARARAWPARPSVGSARGRRPRLRARAPAASASRGGTSSPVAPGTTRSGMPPTPVASTGSPAAIASRIEYGRPSQSLISDERVAVGELRPRRRRGGRAALTRSPRPSASRCRSICLAVGAVAEHAQLPGLAARPRKRVQQRGQVLGRREPRGAAEHEAAAGGRRGGRAAAASTPLWMTCRPPRGEMPRSRASARSWFETHTIASLSGRDRALGRRVGGARGAGAARERPAVRGEHGAARRGRRSASARQRRRPWRS